MKLFVFNLVKFIVFGSVSYVVLLIAAGKVIPQKWQKNLFVTKLGSSSTYNRLKEMDTTNNVDVLILGTSHAYMGYDPRIFKQHNWRLVILATKGQTFIQTELLFKRYINHLKPKFVIFDIYPAEFSGIGAESAVDIISNTYLQSDIFKMALKLKNVKVYNTLIYSMLIHPFGMKKTDEKPQKDGFGTYITGGFLENYDKYKQPRFTAKIAYKVDAEQFIAFKNVTQLLKERKVPYVLIQAPITQGKYISINNNDSIDSMLNKYGNYYNFNKIIAIPNNGFKDEHHLNQTGVNMFDTKLIQILGDTIDKECKKDWRYSLH